MSGISQDMKKQDNKLAVSNEERIVENQCFMTIGCLNQHVEDCERNKGNHIVSYSLVKEIERTLQLKDAHMKCGCSVIGIATKDSLLSPRK